MPTEEPMVERVAEAIFCRVLGIVTKEQPHRHGPLSERPLGLNQSQLSFDRSEP